ncbi:YopX family protein [Enterococcus faecalis]|uniref:YopX family protein n=1 Tax=Enterococcus faecalis TaxID=1351 RepID=UPI0001F0B75A|nr:YopX family protein [Enterococcus faecalis]EFT47810.1 phage conserved hypothetical protein TIGR01671 [Enterococcus faecalis TX0027]
MIPKFRAWDKDSKVMREIQHLVWAEDNLIAHCPPRGHEFSEWFTVILNGWEYQLMQSTGLKDKNGVEIFEGDVVKVTDGESEEDSYISVVKNYSNEGYPAFDIEYPPTYHYDSNVLSAIMCNVFETIEVIGNVYEDGDLLNDSEDTKRN